MRGQGYARTAAAGFLARYVQRGGRVVRLDQGDDTVSGGQAQGMLVSAALGNKGLFQRIWGWAHKHLQRSDGLLASRWASGRIANAQPASDADLDAARALLIASQRFHMAGFRAAALRIARAVLAEETITRGRVLVLVTGPWARSRGIVDPGYWAPHTLELLQRATGDQRWGQLDRGIVRLTGELTAGYPHLPSDWAVVSASGSIRPSASPPGRPPAPPQYSLDAARVPIRSAEACSASARRISASVWPFFGAQGASQIGAAYALDGTLTNRNQTAIALVGAAASAQAAGQPRMRDALLAQAQSINARFPTYYGAAWIAVARLELGTTALGGCA